ncbi:MAG: asparagine synthase (glutamine-hydrolyzing) [Vicinamibacteria bacterium]|nr:asparagine synthase (glutamine-hydrolyzing) [Vicinamibacteria bacterium]
MCGIAGAFGWGRASAVDAAALRSMSDAMPHRGPDDEGLFVDPSGAAGFSFRRLSIVDLSPAGHQPMSSEGDRFTLMLNGEIYNHLELRQGLVERGHRFTGRSDAEAALHLIEEAGADGVRELHGKFAVAVWARETERLLVARDRLGVKPLYYWNRNGLFLFASEIKSLLAHPEVARTVDWEGVGSFLTFMATPSPRTCFEGIRKLPPGHLLEITRAGAGEPRAYWDPASAPAARSVGFEEAAAETRRLVALAVRRRCMADVPIGAFLSGGVDSSAVVALMAEAGASHIKTFSVGYEDAVDLDERRFARQVSDQFGTEHREVIVGAKEVAAFLPRLVVAQDEPLGDPVCVPLHYVSRLARDSGIKVVQLGEGADELFCGYPWYLPYLEEDTRFQRLAGLFGAGPVRAASGLFAKSLGAIDRAPDLRRLLSRRASATPTFLGGAVVFSAEEVADVLLPAHGDCGVGNILAKGALARARSDFDMLSRMTDLELRQRLPELLLMRVDKMGMANSIEGRVPFLDHELVEFVLPLPQSLKLERGLKGLLKHAVRDLLPPPLLARPKVGFPAPVARWFAELGEPFMRKALLESPIVRGGCLKEDAVAGLWAAHRENPRRNAVHLWLLLNLAAWHAEWIERRPLW